MRISKHRSGNLSAKIKEYRVGMEEVGGCVCVWGREGWGEDE